MNNSQPPTSFREIFWIGKFVKYEIVYQFKYEPKNDISHKSTIVIEYVFLKNNIFAGRFEFRTTALQPLHQLYKKNTDYNIFAINKFQLFLENALSEHANLQFIF